MPTAKPTTKEPAKNDRAPPVGRSVGMSAIQSTAAPAPPQWIPVPLYQMTVEKYEARVESGVFTKRDKLHLINGFLVKKMTKNPPHVLAADLTLAALEKILAGQTWHVRIESPVRLPPGSEPEPDVSVAAGRQSGLWTSPPGACGYRAGRGGRLLQFVRGSQARGHLRRRHDPRLLDRQPG